MKEHVIPRYPCQLLEVHKSKVNETDVASFFIKVFSCDKVWLNAL